jgi:tetratricopeptide (TPR) repeat protein
MNKLITSLLFLLTVCCCYAQDASFEDRLNEATSYYENGLYDRAVSTASSLIILDASRAEGYLLSAMVFAKQNELGLAKELLEQASGKTTGQTKYTESFVQEEIRVRETLNEYLQKATENKENKNHALAAEYFTKAYQLNPAENVDYAVEALDILLDKKDYFTCLTLLESLQNSPSQDVVQYASEMIKRVNNVPEVKKENQFNDYLSIAERHFGNKQFESALHNYEKAYSLKGREDISKKISDTKDEIAFAKAAKGGYIEDYEVYRSEYPYGIHIDHVHKTLQRGYLSVARKASLESEYEKAESFFRKYIRHYPYGDAVADARREMCDLYYRQGKVTELARQPKELQKTVDFYKKALECNHPSVTQPQITKMEKKVARWSKPDEAFMAWHADTANLIGMMVGGLNNRVPGVYFGGRTNVNMFREAELWRTNNAASIEKASDKSLRNTGERRICASFVTIGLTQKITRPLWIYAGAGIAYTVESKKFFSEEKKSEVWADNEESSQISFNPEAGLQVLLGPITLRYGLNKPWDNILYPGLVQSFIIGFKI